MIHHPFTSLSDLSFEFRTINGVVYHAYFISYSELFRDFPDFAKDVYSFNLEVVIADSEDQVTDDRIAQTVVAIFQYFFSARQNVAIYICDSADDRHLARKKNLISGFGNIMTAVLLKKTA